MKTKSLEKYFAKQMKNKAYAKAYEEIHYLVDIGVNIAFLRDKAGLSQGQLAKKIGTTQSVVSRIENANQNMTLKMLMKIARALHCELFMQLKPAKMAA